LLRIDYCVFFLQIPLLYVLYTVSFGNLCFAAFSGTKLVSLNNNLDICFPAPVVQSMCLFVLRGEYGVQGIFRKTYLRSRSYLNYRSSKVSVFLAKNLTSFRGLYVLCALFVLQASQENEKLNSNL